MEQLVMLEVRRLGREICDLRAENAAMREERDALYKIRMNMDSAIEQIDSLSKLVRELRMRVYQLENDLEQARDENTALRRTNCR